MSRQPDHLDAQPFAQPSPSAPHPSGFAPFATRMVAIGCSQPAIDAFARQYGQLSAGATGLICEAEALPVGPLVDAARLPAAGTAAEAGLERLVVIKLNGGLGTSMGLAGPKSLLSVHDQLSFLDILARQILTQRHRTRTRLPLVLMNSFSTETDTQLALAAYPELSEQAAIPTSFLQGRVPKVSASDLAPIDWPQDPAKAWCPPGHGEIYQAISQSGLLRQMLDAGFDTAFISNVDNLGATVDLAILSEFRRRSWSFLMEVADRTPADRKGGHLARSPAGGLLLRELAQCPAEDLSSFQDIERHPYFNTNNLWIHLPTLAELLETQGGFLDLPMIRNEKPVDPARPGSPRVYQLESAMGAAIALFPRAAALRVSRSRFLPVKKTSDLLGLWSDAYALGPDGALVLKPERGCRAPQVNLDDRYYASMADLALRFPYGAPSLIRCESLTVSGDVRFGRDVQLSGAVTLQAPPDAVRHIPDGANLRGQP
ncbi:MAG: UTP--glucose-1-phosphate uridylyltransferase [Anaerolineae bacterium]